MNQTDFSTNCWNHLHDVIFHVFRENKSREELVQIFEHLPKELQEEAYEYGISDTLVREHIIEYLENRK